MDILGIGPLELFFILIIALIVLGPKDMVKAGQTIGRTLRKIVTSSSWSAIKQTSDELKKLPNKLMRDASLEENLKELNSIIPKKEDFKLSIDDPVGETTGNQEYEQEKMSTDDSISEWVTPPSEREADSTIKPASQSEQNS